MGLLDRLLKGGQSSENQIKKIQPFVQRINELESGVSGLSDADLRDKTIVFRERLDKGESLDDIMCEAFAVVREASVRALSMRHFDVQLIGGVVLHQGRIAEMKTGEGKTLVATLPAYLNALTGAGVHIVTVNDYLARRDSEWMGKLHRFLGLSVGLVLHDMRPEERQAAYRSDITYATNNELGFDYLRDNMVVYQRDMVQRDLAFGIVDEVDSILIDEARTPLIISGPSEKSTELYERADRLVSGLREEADYTKDEKQRAVTLTEQGVHKAERHFGVENLTDPDNTELYHHVNQALRAHALMHRDKDYVVQDGEVIIVDEFTGRLMTGRRYSDGLHQAIEAKEHVHVQRESKTLATITFQNYFRMYKKLSGMTGTAKTEEPEFQGIYKLDVVEIPTDKKMIREDLNDVVITTMRGKFDAVVEEIVQRHNNGQPILVGTVSVEKSEYLSDLLKRRGIRHNVLNAKHHQKEAEIVAQAGKYGAVTIATNMAGRGTDILLGGNPDFLVRREMRQQGVEEHLIEEATGHADTRDPEILEARRLYQELYAKHKEQTDDEKQKVLEAGGLYILGTERHESRRIDNQLRGRAGRQGDPGASRFFISMEDDLMRLFGSERVQGLMERLGAGEDVQLEYGMLSKQIESAQKRVEGKNFDIRKHVLQYDDVMNQQREIIYKQRREVLTGQDIHGNIMDMLRSYLERVVETYCPESVHPEEWDLKSMGNLLGQMFMPAGALDMDGTERDHMTKQKMLDKLSGIGQEQYRLKEKAIAENGGDMREIERVVLLRVVDQKWMDHIDAMDQLRQGIGLRAYGQRDPVVEYKMEGYDMFEEMVSAIQHDTLHILFHVNVERAPERKRVAPQQTSATHGGGSQTVKKTNTAAAKIGRNAPCPCGSGKKYKNCCGAS